MARRGVKLRNQLQLSIMDSLEDYWKVGKRKRKLFQIACEPNSSAFMGENMTETKNLKISDII